MGQISRDRAERIAKSHACVRCEEYSYKKVAVKAASDAQREALKVVWQATMICGVCGAHFELGIDEEGDVAYAG